MTRTWLIIGGSRGLGKALVLAALEAGDRVVATSRKLEALASLVAEHGVKVTIVEPGGIRTGWATGAAEPSGPITPDYEQTVGAWLDRFAQYAGTSPATRTAWPAPSSTPWTPRSLRAGCCSAATHQGSRSAQRKAV